MAKGEQQPKLLERGVGLDRNIHVAVGAVALGAEVVTGSAGAEIIAVFEGLHALALEGLRRFIKNRQSNKPQTA